MKLLNTSLYLLLVSLAICKNVPQEGRHLIKLGEHVEPKWLTEPEVFDLIRNRKHFFDLTYHPEEVKLQSLGRAATVAIPTKVAYSNLVNSTFSKIDKAGMSKFLTSYSAFHTRFFLTKYGVQASKFLLQQVKEVTNGYLGNVSVQAYQHPWPQDSVIARIEGSDLQSEVVIIGAHLDSINIDDPLNGAAPGADDDGSGTVAVLEILRVLINSNFKPRRTIEFQFYAAEEIGILGSQDIANDYALNNVNVVGMLQLDMTGYSELNKIEVLTDYTDPDLTQFTRLLIDNYCTYKWIDGECGYACSDHASFNRVGYRSTQPGEDNFNKRLHTPQDTTQFVNYDHVAQFVRLGLGFAIELAEPATK